MVTGAAPSGTERRCIVVGGSGKVGAALCRALVAEGARVAFTFHRGKQVADALVQELGDRVSAHALDLTKPEALAPCLDAMLAKLRGIDALLHCAVLGSTCEPATFDRLADIELDGWNRLMQVNVASAFFASRHVAAKLGEHGGNIVLFGSVDGIKPVPSPVPYAVSKAALRGLVLSLSKTLGSKNIRVNLVTPGILTEGVSQTLPADLKAEYLKHCGLRRLGSVAEVTGVATFLALSNSYVTGQTVLLDGGL